jgi:hypothetical protein
MNTRTLRGSILVVMVTFAGMAVQAQESTAKPQQAEVHYAAQFDRLMRGLEMAKRSDVPGVIESTIYNLVQCKSMFPNREYSRHIRWLDEMSTRSGDATIAYKAGLASMYLRYGSPISDPWIFDPVDHEKAFKTVAAQLAAKLLATNIE